MNFDVIVVGGGHAGTEAALAAGRVGASVAMVTMRPDRIAHMPCNCSIGGPAKGHLVREIDAMGGAMARATDACMTHVRWVGTGKGPAIRTLRAHADKELYPAHMRCLLEVSPRISMVAAEVHGVELVPGGVRLRLATGEALSARSVVITAGTFLDGLMHRGEEQRPGGRLGEGRSSELASSLRSLGLGMGRFKTGTTPRIHAGSVDWSVVERVDSESCPPFSFALGGERPTRPLLPCWLTRTTEATRDVILDSLHLSAMYAGRIDGIGPRYCPSIEDKMVRFPDRSAHPVFLEQETWDGPSLYVQGTSTSLPAEVQLAYLRTIPGLANAVMLEAGYAVEYDVVLPHQLTRALACRPAPGLFFAGQVNGTSGYEEAAAQGLLAGANAALAALGRDPLVVGREAGYIGVMVDDLVTRGVTDPYRLLTSRAEFRLLLRHDNADLRLAALGHSAGLVDEAAMETVAAKREALAKEAGRLGDSWVTPADNERLADVGSAAIGARTSLLELLRRPEVTYQWLVETWPPVEPMPENWAATLEAETKYAGYIERQREQVAAMARLEGMAIPDGLDVSDCRGISLEGREKLARVRPATVGQAGRIPGLTPADIQSLAVLVYRHTMTGSSD